MLRPLYDWCLRLAGRKNALPVLGGVSFLESVIFPIPVEAMMVPMVLAHPARAWRIALVATVTSILGAVVGYYIGYALFETIGTQIVALYGYAEQMADFRQSYEEYGALIVAIGAFTPIPFKVVTVTSGLVEMNLLTFVLAGFFARGIRYFIVCGLLWKFGPPIRTFVEDRLNLVAAAVGVVGVLGFLLVRFL
ncbi:MAG: DedA family protein [Alphaproteobacteria bacterium]|nr:DedA family protein [Alphaproteobacteria bacterium]